jgi:hypothetical protein
MEFEVSWKIKLDADSEVGAAKKALEIMRDPSSLATVFEVCEVVTHKLVYKPSAMVHLPGEYLPSAEKAEKQGLERTKIGNTPDDACDDPDEIGCTVCDASVHREDQYFATPCGTYCSSCMQQHTKECEICAAEFELERV